MSPPLPRWSWPLWLLLVLGCTVPVDPLPPDAGLPGPGAACSGTCATGSACLKGTCYARTCTGETCSGDQVCSSGRCVDPRCVGVSCGSGGTCVAGNCYAQDCATAACADGQVCESNRCTELACVGVQCPATQACRAGSCEELGCTGSGCPDGGLACPEGQVLDGGVCVTAGETGQDGGTVCAVGQVRDGGACVPAGGNRALGQGCAAGSDCASGFCADGLCCDGACAGDCVTCAGLTPGRCGPVSEGNAEPGCGTYRCSAQGACLTACTSGSECQAGASCKEGACVAPGLDGSPCTLGLACASGHCVEGLCCNTACDGACDRCDLPGSQGTCTPAPLGSAGVPACVPYVCTGGAVCATSCASAMDCVTGLACVGGQCIVPRVNGEGCAVAAECGSGQCVDGVCCGTPCDGACVACNLAGSLGTCAPHAAGEDPEGECGGGWCGGGAACSADCSAAGCKPGLACLGGTCVGTQGGGAPCSSGAQCQSGSCADGVCCDAACTGACQQCNVQGKEGTCTPAAAGTDPDGDCGGLWCGGAAACLAQCSGDPDCKAGLSCVQGKCLAQKQDGQACAAGADCASGNCVDGVCCGSACGGTCEACNLPGKLGSCSAIAAGTDPAGECGAGYCGGNRACSTACVVSSSCKPGTACLGGTCGGKLPNGSACNAGGVCASGQCVDGVCCNIACDGKCEACNLAGNLGACTALSSRTDPGAECGATWCSGSAPACLGSCALDTDCKAGFACISGTCRALATNGTACTRDGECVSTHCADGVCCNTACGGACDACAQQGSVGVCKAQPARSAGDPSCAPYACEGVLATCPSTCALEADCAAGLACVGTVCVQKLQQGAACVRTEQCAAGVCVDGVCCGTACTGICRSCNAGTPGTCGVLPAGTDPANECAGDTTCDGAGACLKAAGAACAAASECQSNFCVDGVCCTSACNGACQACSGAGGTCVNATSGTDPASECGRYQCAVGACATYCSGAGDCKSGSACAGGKCLAPAKAGDPCAVGTECQSGFCADRVCCNTACTGTCEACNGGTLGTCSGVPSGTDPDNECAGDTTCNGSGACLKGAGVACAAGSECQSNFCVDGVCCTSACNGACQACTGVGGTCVDAAAGTDPASECGNYQCAAGACATACTGTGAGVCKSGAVCSGGKCVVPGKGGVACSDGTECQSGFCADGVCCNSACTGTCEECNGGTPGACSAVPAGTDPASECAGDTTCNGAGACLKAAGVACAAGSECQSSSCVDGVCCTSACNGACQACTGAGGNCVGAATGTDPASECGNYFCAASGCATGCTRMGDCKPGFVCSAAGKCIVPVQRGGACASGVDCQSGFCANEVCCNSACVGKCESCNLEGNGGTCTAYAAGTDPELDCPGETCGGQSSCVPISGGTCTADVDCGDGQFCGSGTCLAKYAFGARCDGVAGHCASGICADGVCCDSACTGTCVSCALAASPGSCKAIPASSDPEGECGPAFCSGTSAACASACATSIDCKPGMACIQEACAGKLPTGQACRTADQCESDFCVDGVCCVDACNGTCSSCALPGSPGTCAPLHSGIDPAGECGTTWCDGAAACLDSCAEDAECKPGYACDGTACVPKKAAGTACARGGECGTGACVDGVCCRDACNGPCDSCAVPGHLGICTPAPGPGTPACAPFACSGVTSGCPLQCATELECALGLACVAGQCVEPLAPGAACERPGQCADVASSGGLGHCVDGVCCDSGCGGACESCNSAGAEGTCTPVPAGTDPDGVCGRYTCDGQVGSCAGACDGQSGTGCKPDSRCDVLTNSCMPKLETGQGCGLPGDCASGFCVDGVCCSGTCGGACESCNQQGFAGICLPAPAGTDPDSDCTANASVCSGRREIPGVLDPCAPLGSSSCADDATCGDGRYCLLPEGICLDLLPNGSPWDGTVGHCASGQEADGVCCDTGCEGTCEACNLGALTGTCTPIPAGQDPQSECDLGFCSGTGAACVVCARDTDCKPGAFCSNGACVLEVKLGDPCGADDNACGSGFCTDGVCCNARCDQPCQTCTALGLGGTCTSLAPGDVDPTCGGFLCTAAGTCATGCAGDAECAPGTACVGGACVAGRGNGAACAGDADCASGQCVQVPGGVQVCCESSCEGLCMACSAAGACVPAALGTDPRGECAGTACDGLGNCQQGLIQMGQSCSGPGDCASGFCVDGYCCENACNGTCESCDQAGLEGLCLAHPAGTDPEAECGAYQCEGRRCGSTCTGNVQCKDTCNGGMCGAPATTYAYGAWSPWSGCGAGDLQETRTRACVENGTTSVDCSLCVAVLGGGGCSDVAACPPAGGGGGGACTPLSYNVCVQSFQDCEAALATRKGECVNTGCGTWTVTTSCRVGGSPSNPNCWGAQATCGNVQQPVCQPLNYNVCTMVSQADCQSTLDRIRFDCLTSGCNSFYAAPCTVGGSPSNAFCWGSQAQCGMDLAPPQPVCTWTEVGFHALTSQPPGSWFLNGGMNGQGAAPIGGRIAWVQTADWNQLYVPSSLTLLDDVAAVSADVFVPPDVPGSGWNLGLMNMSAGYNDVVGGLTYGFEPASLGLFGITHPRDSIQPNCCSGPQSVIFRSTSPTSFAGGWHRLRVEFSRLRGTFKFYVDGTLVGSAQGIISWDYLPVRLDSSNMTLFVPANVGWSNLKIERGTTACVP